MSEVIIEFAVGGEGGRRKAARVVTGGWRFERKARQSLRMAGLYIYMLGSLMGGGGRYNSNHKTRP